MEGHDGPGKGPDPKDGSWKSWWWLSDESIVWKGSQLINCVLFNSLWNMWDEHITKLKQFLCLLATYTKFPNVIQLQNFDQPVLALTTSAIIIFLAALWNSSIFGMKRRWDPM